MNRLITIFASLALAAVSLPLTSCNDDDVNVEGPGLSSEFRVSADNMRYLRTGGEQTLCVVSRQKPAVSSSESWLRAGEPALNGDSRYVWAIPLTADAYTGYDARTATVTVTAGTDNATVAVTQNAADGLMLAEGFTAPQLPAEGGSFTVPVMATGDFTVEADSWIVENKAAKSRSLDNRPVSFTVGANESPIARSGRILFTLADNPDMTLEVTVNQAMGASAVTGMTAIETARDIKVAVNIGNTMEAIGGETAWGASLINESYIQGIKDAGFSAVRLPVAWYNHCDKSTLTIDAVWMNRVEEVVNLCISKGLYVFLNIHWDEGWMEENDASYSADVDNIQRTLWGQIAPRFNSFGSKLIFCGANEAGENTQASADALKTYMQTFIDVVRGTGGNNATRVLVVQAPGTNIDNGVKYCKTLPTDPAEDRLMFEVHYYDPSDFTIMQQDDQWSKNTPVKYFWGKDYKTGTSRDCNWADESYLDNQMQKLKENFVDKGIPVFLGEFGCGRRTTFLEDIDKEKHYASRAYYHKYLVSSAKAHGVIPCYWETPDDMFARANGAIADPANLQAVMEGAETSYPF